MRILIADDHELFRDGLRLVLGDLGPDVDIQEASTFDETLTLLRDTTPTDAVLLDLVMPGMVWVDGLRALRAAAPQTPLVVLSASEEPQLVTEAMRQGAAGFIPKTSSSKVMLSALRLVLSGGVYLPPQLLARDPTRQPAGGDSMVVAASQASVAPAHTPAPEAVPLTPRQREVLALLGQGKSNKEIARILDLSEGTVKLHVTAILKALKVTNRTSAVVAASKLGLTDLDGL